MRNKITATISLTVLVAALAMITISINRNAFAQTNQPQQTPNGECTKTHDNGGGPGTGIINPCNGPTPANPSIDVN